MTSRDFCFWFQGFLELNPDNGGMSKTQLDIVAKHLKLVFIHEIDPSAGEKQDILNFTHNLDSNVKLRC